jgi:ankyrin repeat protein
LLFFLIHSPLYPKWLLDPAHLDVADWGHPGITSRANAEKPLIIIQSILDTKPNVNIADYKGLTPLHYAAAINVGR